MDTSQLWTHVYIYSAYNYTINYGYMYSHVNDYNIVNSGGSINSQPLLVFMHASDEG